ncbi:MAG: hypothetical protein AB7E28_07555 [Desulfurella sp.]
MSVNIRNINGTIIVERGKTADEIQQENEQILSQTIAQLTLENADLKVQLQTLAQTIAQMQLK